MHLGALGRSGRQFAQQRDGILTVSGQAQHLRLDQLHVGVVGMRIQLHQRPIHAPGGKMRSGAVAANGRGTGLRRQRGVEAGHGVGVAPCPNQRIAQQA